MALNTHNEENRRWDWRASPQDDICLKFIYQTQYCYFSFFIPCFATFSQQPNSFINVPFYIFFCKINEKLILFAAIGQITSS